MNKRFNTTGTCIKDKHYMMDITDKLNKIAKMIDYGNYFIINRPRQFGKTTTLSLLTERLNDDYIVISMSFEGVGDEAFTTEQNFCRMFINQIIKSFRFTNIEEYKRLKEMKIDLHKLDELSDFITEYIEQSDREVILIIDEVDKASDNQLFLSFLGMLRTKYLQAAEKRDLSFKSVILAGVHDIKNLKLKLRTDDERKYNSPWNIAVNFNIDMNCNSKEIESMIIEYCNENDLYMNTEQIAEKIYYYTSGYPFLVSRLCQIIDEEITSEKCIWSNAIIEKSLKNLLRESNTLFDDLFKNLENNQELSELVFDIVFNGANKQFNTDNPIIKLANVYGIIKDSKGIAKVSNRIFEQRIYNYFSSKLETKTKNISNYNFKQNFILENGGLDIEKILLKFQQFMKEQYSSKDTKFLEQNGRILFLAFIKPIINGVGFDFKEVQISEEKRLDVVITYNRFKYIVELKVWRGQSYHEKGLNQLKDYLDIHGLKDGYLLVFNFNKNKEYISERALIDDKNIAVVYV